jgi:hypothetical protein
MQLNISPVELTPELNDTINRKVQNHVIAMRGSCQHYTNMRNATKPELDIFVGKKAEYFVSAYLTYHCGFPVIEPDTIYLTQMCHIMSRRHHMPVN